MSTDLLIGPRPRGLEPHLGELPESLFDDHVYACCELADRYATELALDLARELGLQEPLSGGCDVEELIAARGFDAAFGPALEALLARLATAGELELERVGAAARYRSAAPLREPEVAALRAAGLALDPANAATLDLFEAAAACYPAVAHGHTTGEKELFGTGHIGNWLAYFSNDNPSYVLNNRLAASVAANRLEPCAAPRILEVGAGAGSATRALLEELRRRGRLGSVARYEFTEPSPFFRRRGERELRVLYPELPLVVHGLDLDRSFDEQGVEGAFDLVVGVNVLHVAHDLGASLRRVLSVLAPGGWLVAGECLRLFADEPVPADLVFQLFEGFVGVVADGEFRSRHGFLEPADWRAALARAGFERVDIVPELEKIRDIYPRFFAGVVVGRRPPVESPA